MPTGFSFANFVWTGSPPSVQAIATQIPLSTQLEKSVIWSTVIDKLARSAWLLNLSVIAVRAFIPFYYLNRNDG